MATPPSRKPGETTKIAKASPKKSRKTTTGLDAEPVNPAHLTLSSAEPQRLQKALAQAGFGSRREIEGWIREGRVMVNGEVAELGCKVVPSDHVDIGGRRIHLERRLDQPPRVIAYHKPEGKLTSRKDPQGRPTVFEDLPELKRGRWISIGRLDINTTGLLLFTNDGALADRLMHPSTGISREYACRILGEVSADALANLQKGVELEDGLAKFDSVEMRAATEGANQWYHVTLREGRNREVRRLWDSQGLTVSRLIRVRYGPIRLDRWLSRGETRSLKPGEIRALYEAAGVPLGSA